jgi:hypothetical protein
MVALNQDRLADGPSVTRQLFRALAERDTRRYREMERSKERERQREISSERTVGRRSGPVNCECGVWW